MERQSSWGWENPGHGQNQDTNQMTHQLNSLLYPQPTNLWNKMGLQIYQNTKWKSLNSKGNLFNIVIILLIQTAKLVNESAKAAMEFIKDTNSHGLEIVMEFISPYMEAAGEFMEKRVKDGNDLFPSLETFMNYLKSLTALIIGFFGCFWTHPMWETLGELMKTGNEMMMAGLDHAREVSTPFVEAGCAMSADYVAKTREMSEQMVDAGVEIGNKAAISAVEYSEVAKNAGEKVLNSVVEYSDPLTKSGKEAFKEAVDRGTAFYEEKRDNGAVSDLMRTISVILITLILTGWLAVFLLSRGDQYQPIVEEESEEEVEGELGDDEE